MWAWKPGGPASSFPGQASSCQDGAQQASSSLMGRNRAQGQSEAFGECTGWAELTAAGGRWQAAAATGT